MSEEPIKVEIVTREQNDDDSGCLDMLGGLAWVAGLTYFWYERGLFESAPGKIGFFVAAYFAFKIGYKITGALIGACIAFLVGGLLIGWIFDFPFFDTTAEYIGIAYRYLFN